MDFLATIDPELLAAPDPFSRPNWLPRPAMIHPWRGKWSTN